MNDSQKLQDEIIILKASRDLIVEMINNSNMSFSKYKGFTQVIPKSNESFKLFVIFLLDFLSFPDKKIVKGESRSYLDALQEISISKINTLNCETNTDLSESVYSFKSWLAKKITIEKVWLPELEIQTSIHIQRMEVIKLLGNLSKHNFSRFGSCIKRLQRILEESGHTLSTEAVIVSSEYLIENFLKTVVVHNFSAIAEFLINIQWAIYGYLKPVYQKQHKQIIINGESTYTYELPGGVTTDLQEIFFWSLMNDTAKEPYISRFRVDPIFKKNF